MATLIRVDGFVNRSGLVLANPATVAAMVSIPTPGITTGAFGPTLGAPTVRANAVPRAVTHPGGSPTVVNPGDNIDSKITAAGAGETLWFTKGTHSRTSLLAPLAGQTWVLESAAGKGRVAASSAVIDGGDGALNALVMSEIADLTIRGGLWTNQGNASSATYASAIIHSGAPGGGGWLVEDAEISGNYNIGLAFQGPNCIGRRCAINDNGRYGPKLVVAAPNSSFLNCEVANNNTRELNPGGDASAMKLAGINLLGATLGSCWIHDNRGFGAWIDNAGTNPTGGNHLVEECVIENNWRTGLFLEGLAGGVVGRHNYVVNNGSTRTIGGQSPANVNNTQIRIADCDSTKGAGTRSALYQNIVDYTRTPTAQDPGWLLMFWNHTGHAHRNLNWDVSSNQLWCRTSGTGIIGGLEDNTGLTTVWNGDIDFLTNEYQVASLATSFWKWDSGAGTGVAKTWAQWQAYGQDVAGSRVLI